MRRKLVATDKTPAGKREDITLRKKEKEIQKDLDDGRNPIGKKMTVCQLYAKQIRDVRHGTKQGKKQLMRILEEDRLGGCPIENVKLSDAQEGVLRMKEKGYSFKTIKNHKRSLKAAFAQPYRMIIKVTTPHTLRHTFCTNLATQE